jgi:hypothetical protein
MGIRSQNNPLAAYLDVFSNTGTDAAGAAAGGVTPASGGNIVSPGGDGYNYHVFTSSGSLVAPGTITGAEILVVGPGGGGSQGNGASGGGGAGGAVHVTGHTLVAGTYTITIPDGGAGGPESAPSPIYGTRGGNLTMTHSSTPNFSVTALGGGGGSPWGNTNTNPAPNRNGGSGGGIGGGPTPGGSEGTGDQPSQPFTVPTGTVNRYGNRGGDTPGAYRGGGGGGAGGVGNNFNGSSPFQGGAGGNGQPFTGFVGPNPAFGPMPSPWKSAVGPTGLYGGGGAGGSENSGTVNPAPGGPGGGGPSGAGPNSAPADDNRGNPAVANTGGGGGAGWWDPGLPARGGDGGKGIVLVRYSI